MTGYIVSVNFGDMLAVTLPRNRPHFDDLVIVTAPSDIETISVARTHDCKIFLTNSFWDDGALFNKFLPLEEALEHYGRHGQIAFVDADIILPRKVHFGKSLRELDKCQWFRKTRIYSADARRLWLGSIQAYPQDDKGWRHLPLDTTNGPDGSAPHSECLGYLQIFNGDVEQLKEKPWFPLDLKTAAGGDSKFQDKWDLSKKRWLIINVLHLGKPAEHWEGRKR